MARKSRIALPTQEALTTQRIFKVGLYVRLSVLNGGKKENDTAETQEAVLRSYVAGKSDFSVVAVYVDNGQTGTDFKRGEFERLIDDVKIGTIDCIVVKDLSRFGRNYIETGEYLEKIFPFLGVRFIAVNDHYDSIDPSASDILTMHLKNLVNDIYARDLSQKICPVIKGKQNRGEYIGNWAPYGYLKSPENKNQLIVDLETAPVVRDIYQWRIEGYGYTDIARRLIASGIPSPGRYRYENGLSKDKRQRNTSWQDWMIKRMLSSPFYLGHTVQGQSQQALWKGQRPVKLPKEKWITIENTHEAIIDEAIFAKVQKINKMVNDKYHSKRNIPVSDSGSENILRGIAVCGTCGVKLKRFKRSYEYGKSESHFHVWYTYNCRTHMNEKERCPFTSINEQKLLDIVFEAVRIQMLAAADMETQMKGEPYLQKASSKKRELAKQIERMTEQLLQVSRHKESLYDDFADHLMSEQDYVYAQKRYQKKEEGLRIQLQELETQLVSIPEAGRGIHLELEDVLRFRNRSCLTREMAVELIERVVVYDQTHITIHFRFEDEFQTLKDKLASVMKVGADV